jgi:phosphohistidine phosphatase
MKTITLVRHGKAIAREPGGDDFKRSLLERGEAESRKMALRLKARAAKPDLLLSSPARRALETANIFARTFRYPLGKIQLDEGFYHHPNGSAFLPAFQALPDKAGHVLLFGHEPTLSEFACLLLPRFEEGLPKSGLISIHFPAGVWQQLEPGTGQLQMLEFPGSGKRARKLFRQIADAELTELVIGFYEAKSSRCAGAMRQRIRKSVAKLNDRFIAMTKSPADG